MATYSKQFLSGSTQGKSIKVVATASPGTTIHTTGTSATAIDEIHLFAHNSSTSSATLTIQFGGTSSPDDEIKLTIPAQSGETYVIPGFILSGNGTAGLSVLAYASVANVITVNGYVNRAS